MGGLQNTGASPGQLIATVKGGTLTITDVLIGNANAQSSCEFVLNKKSALTPQMTVIVQPGSTVVTTLKTGLIEAENTSIYGAMLTLGLAGCNGTLTITGVF